MRRAAMSAARLGTWGAARLRPAAVSRPPAERSVLDDIAARRPWNLAVKAARVVARRRMHALSTGVSVVIVSYNTRDVTADTVRAVQRLSPRGTPVLVVDNGSSDGTREMLRSWSGVRTLLLPRNAGHGVALDLAMCVVRTSVALVLDSDAIPLAPGWMDPACAPVLTGEAVLAGLRSRRNYVHPVYLALDVRTFLTRRVSFQVHRSAAAVPGAERWGEDAWDTGELMTSAIGAAGVRFVDRSDNPAPGLPGMTVGGVVYHHGGVTRESTGTVSEAAYTQWRAACAALGVSTGGSASL